MKKITMICVALAMLFVGCKKVNVDFTYSPAEPKAGESVKFTNMSSSGESWDWAFSDNTTSKMKHPSKVFQKPGEYTVTLVVDSAKYNTCTKVITVYDTIPTFVANPDSILLYHDVQLKANVYNPFNHTLSYKWALPANAVLQSGSLTDASIVVYFKEKGEEIVGLLLTQKDKEYDIERALTVYDVQAPALLMHKTNGEMLRQRMINDRLEQVSTATSADEELLAASNDTVVEFNGVTFTASKMSANIPLLAQVDVQHIQLDAMKQKWYLTGDAGLMVANFDGSEQVVIDAKATGAMYVDTERNRLYWANTEGVWAMPLVKSKNNQYTTEPVQYNNQNNVDLVIINNTLQ